MSHISLETQNSNASHGQPMKLKEGLRATELLKPIFTMRVNLIVKSKTDLRAIDGLKSI